MVLTAFSFLKMHGYFKQKKEEAKYRNIIDTAMEGFTIIDSNGNFIEVNKAFCNMLNYSREQILKMNIKDLDIVEKDDEIAQHIYRIKEYGHDKFETQIKGGNGMIINVEVSISHMIQCNKDLYFSFVRDVTQIRNIEEVLGKENIRLKALNDIKSEFISVVAHDLRTPLTSIIGFADTLSNKKIKLTEDKKEIFLGYIKEESNRLGRLISDFLDIHTMEEGKLEFDFKKVNIGVLINNTLRMHSINTKGIRLVFEFEQDLPELSLDKDRIRQVLQNLIENAIKYSPQNSVVTVTAKKNLNEVQIKVIDQGPCVPKDEREKVFQKFYRSESDVLRKKRGTGLGLSIVKMVIEKHGGKIWVEDNFPFGCCFVFNLPINDKNMH
ncbi:MAG: hypothetical protein A2474_01865 [Elusimicrobia bacterium RIFOXYC2_FULL_34_12]|nr:MAG: hypothetical protein A2474_01865 [Elusimicrobia bacterium RIFOXYC2_FULL_34_12]OGS38653.1 MAG: hypothetical protein A2551_06515 [Elusimicrobia bacterium RIFOXYD2_FULL_34_30]HAM39489.1 hypothetical protein [Elusimicrobiota bacterium]